MSKKSKSKHRTKHHKSSLSMPSGQFESLLVTISQYMVGGDYASAATLCERLLSYLPQRSKQRAEVLAQLGSAHAMLQNFPQSYEALTEALSIEPNDADLWYNRGITSRFTARVGQSVRDFERAAELNTNPQLTKRIAEEVKFSRELAEKSMKLRGPDFTLDQLIEQENHYQSGLKFMEIGKWEEAEEAFRRTIEMGDCLPQPWGNLGVSLIMQKRYDEAEEALKRALVIDPKYAIAKKNLADLPEVRRKGGPQMIEISDPFKQVDIKKSISFTLQE